VTGGSSGIGKSLAVQLAKSGANVTILARNEERLQKAKEEVAKHLWEGRKERLQKAKEEVAKHLWEGRKVGKLSMYSTTDLRNILLNSHVFHRPVLVFGPVDLLFNCAGYAICGRFDDLKIDDFKNMMNTNYFGSVYPTYAVIKSMKARQQGHVVFVSSMGGQFGIFGLSAYSASKFAIRGFAECLFMEVKPYNVGVSVVFPPDTDTPGFENENKNKPEETHLICSSGGLFPPDHVAQKQSSKVSSTNNVIKGVQSRQFLVTCGFDGWALNTVTSGATPFTSCIELITQ
ncbi:hypothetical protein QZH41_012765, partial [Actinostola sp. cb2023]